MFKNVEESESPSEKIYYNKYRLQVIEMAMANMKTINEGFLKKYALTPSWNKINSGFISHNIQVSLGNLVEFKICESDKWESSFFNPFEKKPITMCYNKFIDADKFNQALDYNMILLYDTKTKKNLNWNNLEDATLANVRALQISGICKRKDTVCFHRELKKRVFDKQRFVGKILGNLDEVIEKGIEDDTPISQVVLRS